MHNGAGSNTVTLPRPKGGSNGEYKADLHTEGVLSTRPPCLTRELRKLDLFWACTRSRARPSVDCTCSVRDICFCASSQREHMRSIKVLLANDPAILREAVRAVIVRQPDMEVVGEILDPLGVLLAAKATHADVVVLGLRDAEEPGLVSHLLAECPQVTILGLAPHGDTALIVQLRPWRKEIVDPSAANLMRALRQAVREPGSAWHEPPSP